MKATKDRIAFLQIMLMQFVDWVYSMCCSKRRDLQFTETEMQKFSLILDRYACPKKKKKY